MKIYEYSDDDKERTKEEIKRYGKHKVRLIKVYESLDACSKALKIPRYRIKLCCDGERYSVNRHVFRYEGSDLPKFKKTRSSRFIVYQYNKDYTFVRKYRSPSGAALLTGYKKEAIERACKQKFGELDGYLWAYGAEGYPKEDHHNIHYDHIYQYDMNNNLVKVWDKTADITRELGINRTNINHACRSKTHVSRGFKWYHEKMEK